MCVHFLHRHRRGQNVAEAQHVDTAFNYLLCHIVCCLSYCYFYVYYLYTLWFSQLINEPLPQEDYTHCASSYQRKMSKHKCLTGDRK